MNKKRFKRELSNLCKNRAVTPYYIEQFFRAKKSFFNDEKVEVLIKDNNLKEEKYIDVDNPPAIVFNVRRLYEDST